MNDWPSSDLKFEEFVHALHMMNHGARQGKLIQFSAGISVRGYGYKFGQILRPEGGTGFSCSRTIFKMKRRYFYV